MITVATESLRSSLKVLLAAVSSQRTNTLLLTGSLSDSQRSTPTVDAYVVDFFKELFLWLLFPFQIHEEHLSVISERNMHL